MEINLFEIKNSTVLVRVGWDLPNLTDLKRIDSSLQTIKLLLSNNNKIILVSKWGRPKGAFNPELSYETIIDVIEKEANLEIGFVNQFKFNDLESGFAHLKEQLQIKQDKIILLENLHFNLFETSKNKEERMELAKKYSEIADYYVDECFISSHRQEATNFEIKEIIPFCYGISYKQEVENLTKLKTNPIKPYIVLMGGAKLETKLPLIKKLLPLADKLIISGLLCFTFLKAIKLYKINGFEQVEIFDTATEDSFLEIARDLLIEYPNKIILPVDIKFIETDTQKLGADMGSKSIELFKNSIADGRTFFWNGTVGFVEKEGFEIGNNQVGEFVASLSNCFKVIGGGDTVASLNDEVSSKFDYVSMGGGASLEFLSK